jgi:hypothetical protein
MGWIILVLLSAVAAGCTVAHDEAVRTCSGERIVWAGVGLTKNGASYL